jgi:hypothetical protein
MPRRTRVLLDEASACVADYAVRICWGLVALLASGCAFPDYGFPHTTTSDSSVLLDVAADVADSGGQGESSVDADIDGAADSGRGDAVDAADAIDATDATDAADANDAIVSCDLVDDLEDGDGLLPRACERSGGWYTYDDGTAAGKMTPASTVVFTPSDIPGGREGSTRAARLYGSGFTVTGVGLGFDFTASRVPYDISAYRALSFYARIGAGTTNKVRLTFPDHDTDADGGVCTTSPRGCEDHFGYALTTLSATWQRFEVPFASLGQEGWGYVAASFDPKRVFGAQFQIDQNTTFDLWVDDVRLVR